MSKESLQLSIRANCIRINEILEMKTIDELQERHYWAHNPKAIEIVQRGKQLRKDLIKLEKLIYK